MAADEPDRIHVLVSGRVQGVGFRYFVRQRADEAGVTGWVRNLRDGRVEAVLKGTPQAVRRVLEDIGRGPAGARVDELVTRPVVAQDGSTGFEVRRTE
jgi:acylphosphatase